MSEESREYNREWMKNRREELRKKRLLEQGYCPVCEIRLGSPYHAPCKFLDEEQPKP